MFPEQQNLVIHWEVGTAAKLGQHAVGRKEEKEKCVCPKKCWYRVIEFSKKDKYS